MRQNIASTISVGLAIVATAATEASAQRTRFDVPPGPLPRALIALGRKAGVTIATTEPGAANVRVRGVRGATSVEAALRVMLAGTGFAAVKIDGSTYAIRRVELPSPRTKHAPPKRAVSHAPDTTTEIVVTAAKVSQALSGYAGTVQVLRLDEPGMRNAEGRGTAAIVDQLPVMASTGLGPGRDKLFVRGIADSSFTGTTQAAVGQYLGEVRLNYNAPDPNLALYDLSRVELLEGPQATLYGAGSLGGILRLVPRRPVRGVTEGSALSSLSLAANGRFGSELAGVVNLSLGSDAAIRAVAYAGTTPGMVDDTQRGLRAVGRSHLGGGRVTTDAGLGNGWSVEVGGTYQQIKHQDARYAEGPDDPPRRATPIAQPATNRFALGEVTVRKRWDSGLELVSASALVDNDLAARYDLSPVVAGVLNDSRNEAVVISNETRLSRSTGRNTNWVVGLHGVSSADYVTNTLDRGIGRLNRTRVGTGVTDLALFGQGAVGIAPDWTATLGGRLSYSEVRILGSLPPAAQMADLAPLKRGVLRILPSAALTWFPRGDLTVYGRYQRGYRVGGLAVIPFVDPVEGLPSFKVGSFRPDTIDMVEVGARFGDIRTFPIAGTLAVSRTRWRDIQADLFDTYGPYTANVGNSRILGLEGSIAWRLDQRFTLSSAVFVAHSTSLEDRPTDALAYRLPLPNIPLFTFRLDAERTFKIGEEATMTARTRVRYVGRSEIGVGGNSLLRQGEYFEVGLGTEARFGEETAFLEIDNLLNVRGNRFGLGNPFTANRGDQRIPLQPRTIRIGLRKEFR